LHVCNSGSNHAASNVVVFSSMNRYNKKNQARPLRGLGRKHAGRLRHYALRACAPYLKVSFQ